MVAFKEFAKCLACGLLAFLACFAISYGLHTLIDPHNEQYKELTTVNTYQSVDGTPVYRVIIDRCYYIKYNGSLTHMGNCPNHGYDGIPPKTAN